MPATTADRPITPDELENRLVVAWQKRRAWSRTDSARWLNDRSERTLAWARRRLNPAPAHSRQMGEWVKRYHPAIFDRAHARLAALPDEATRETALLEDILRL